jgi:DNA-binding response OmpR family regulator
VVDDEYDVTYTLEKVLENNGIIVDSYNDPTLALSNLKPGSYDLVLLDIKMPKMDGFELYQKIKEIDNKARICFLTASEMFYEEYRSLNAYPTLDTEYFIQKPFRTEELIRNLKTIMNSTSRDTETS